MSNRYCYLLASGNEMEVVHLVGFTIEFQQYNLINPVASYIFHTKHSIRIPLLHDMILVYRLKHICSIKYARYVIHFTFQS